MSNYKKSFVFAILVILLLNATVYSQTITIPKFDKSKFQSFDASKLSQLLQDSKTKPRKEIFLKSKSWIHDTYIFLIGFYQGMGFAELEANLGYETNVFNSKMLSSTWDKIGNISLISGSFISGLMLILPENNFLNMTNDTKLMIGGISIGLGGILKGVGNIIGNSENNKNVNDLFAGISKVNDVIPLISVSRQAIDDIKIRKELYAKIRTRMGTSILSLSDFDEYCKPDSTKNDDETYKYLDDNKDKLKQIGDDLEIAGTQVGEMYDNIESRVNYYIEIYKKFGKKENEEEIPLIKIQKQIKKEREDPIVNMAKNKNYFFVIRDLGLAYL